MYYQREGEVVMYEDVNKSYNNCEADITDNLVKQAKTIFKPKPEDFDKYFRQFGVKGLTHSEVGKTISKT